MTSKKLSYVLLVILIFSLFFSGCSLLKIDKNNNYSKLPSSEALNQFIKKNKIENIVYTEDLYNKYTIVIYEESPKKYGYYITTSYHGRVVATASSEFESYDKIPDFNIGYRTSSPKFLMIRISKSVLSDIDKIVIKYTDPQNNNVAKEIIVDSVKEYNIITNDNGSGKEIITNITDIEVYNSNNEVIYRNDNKL